MKFIVELLAFGQPGEVREVEISQYTMDTLDDPEQALDTIFSCGQNEVQPQNHPSVSAGDVIHIGEDRWLIMAVGFHKLTESQYKEYAAAPYSARLSLSMFGFGKPV